MAERLAELIGCAERSRFFSCVPEALAAALATARAVTGRAAVIRWLGDGDGGDDGRLASAAALLVEPPALIAADARALAALTERVRRAGGLVIFDETVTGFRLALGGAQQRLGVSPDLAVLGEAMANGQPLAALVGRAEAMAGLAPVAGPGSGGALALAAALATLDKMARLPVIDRLWQVGGTLLEELPRLIARHGLEEAIAVSGPAPWSRLVLADQALGHRLRLGLRARGVLTDGTNHMVSYAINATDLGRILTAYDDALEGLARDRRRRRRDD